MDDEHAVAHLAVEAEVIQTVACGVASTNGLSELAVARLTDAMKEISEQFSG